MIYTIEILVLVCVAICTTYYGEASATNEADETKPCGDWEPYTSEKCVKIFDVGVVEREKGEAICRDAQPDDHSRLVTIKTLQEQQFLTEFVFKKNKAADNVWLGINPKGSNKESQWVDRSSVRFSNWAEEVDSSNQKMDCAQMQNSPDPGVWSWAPCNKSNVVVCEKFQAWSLKTLQQKFLLLKMTFAAVTSDLKEQIEILQVSRTVPVGYIYVQLSYQLPPTDLWPSVVWKDVSAYYAGLFFRVAGGMAAEMCEIQPENSPRLVAAKYEKGYDDNPIEIAANGSWSARIYSGSDKGEHWGLRFIVSDGEVRPKNQAVSIWQCIK